MTTTYDAVVLAGGSSRRMAVEDKTRLVVGGAVLLDRVLAACGGAAARIVVGEPRSTEVEVAWTREDPPGGGPAAALASALPLVTSSIVVVLAGDLPFVDRPTVDSLVTAVGDRDGAVLVDTDGREQWLCSAWRSDALGTAALVADGSVRAALGALSYVPVPIGVPGAAPWIDCDTPADVTLAEELLR